MVVSVSGSECGEVIVDPLADRSVLGKVEGSSFHWAPFAGGNQARIGGEVGIGHDFEVVVEGSGGEVAGEIPIDVIDEIDRGGGVGGGGRFENKLVIFGQPIGHFGFEVAGITLIAVIRIENETDALCPRTNDRFAFPESPAEPVWPAVEMTRLTARFVVAGKLVGDSVEGELPTGNPVAETSDRCTEVIGIIEPRLEVGLAEGDFFQLSVAVGSQNRGDESAVFAELDPQATGTPEGEESDCLSVFGVAKRDGFQGKALVEDFDLDAAVEAAVGFAVIWDHGLG